MNRHGYKLFSPTRIGPLELPNRVVRSGTVDLSLHRLRGFTEEDAQLYRDLARGRIGLIVVNGPQVVPELACASGTLADWEFSYDEVRVSNIAMVLDAIRQTAPSCKVIAQLECNALIAGDQPAGPSPMKSPYYRGAFRELSITEIRAIAHAHAAAIVEMMHEGFDGVQLHGAHSGGLWHFLSPISNFRTDEYGGSTRKRVRIIADIIEEARQTVNDFPILVKANCTDYLEGGIDAQSFPDLARELELAGVDAIEVSGGTWDALVRPEEELGFRPVPGAESHTGILAPEKQNYFQPFIEDLSLEIPIILVGGIRNAERAEEVVQSGTADLVAMCRPLIREPNLVARWYAGDGPADAECVACNSCIHSMYLSFETMGRKTVTCLQAHSTSLHREAQAWLSNVIAEIRVDESE